MATSSILENIYIQDSDEVKKFLKAMDQAINTKPKPVKNQSKVVELKGKAIRDYFKKDT